MQIFEMSKFLMSNLALKKTKTYTFSFNIFIFILNLLLTKLDGVALWVADPPIAKQARPDILAWANPPSANSTNLSDVP